MSLPDLSLPGCFLFPKFKNELERIVLLLMIQFKKGVTEKLENFDIAETDLLRAMANPRDGGFSRIECIGNLFE